MWKIRWKESILLVSTIIGIIGIIVTIVSIITTVVSIVITIKENKQKSNRLSPK